MVRILFFGATADTTGKRAMDVESGDGDNVSDVVSHLLNEFPKLKPHDLRFALNEEYINGNEIVRDGDELAIFTAVSGG